MVFIGHVMKSLYARNGWGNGSSLAPVSVLPDQDRALMDTLGKTVQPDISRTHPDGLLEQRNFEMALLYEAGARLTRELDLVAICRSLCEIVGRLMMYDSFVVSRYDRAERLIRAVYVFHEGEEVDGVEFPPLDYDADAPISEDTGTQGRAISTGKSLLLNDYEAYLQNRSGYFYENGEISSINFERTPPEIETTRSALIVPLKLDAAVTGVVQLQSSKLDAFSEDQLHFLEALAPQVAIALQNGRLHSELLRVNAELEARVEARTAELKAALEQQQEINAFKMNLISMLAHDFRTPLTVIQSSAHTLQRYYDRLEGERRDQHFQHIQNQIQHLNSIIEDTLIIGQADSTALQPQLEPVDMVALIQSICEELRSKMPDRVILFAVTGMARPLLMDAVLLRQAVTNLLTNALKYSLASAPVYCEVSYGESSVRVIVRDEGIGIPAKDQQHLFEAFYRASNVGRIQGTGMGLAIIRYIVSALNGRVHFDSKEGVGTSFTLEFSLT